MSRVVLEADGLLAESSTGPASQRLPGRVFYRRPPGDAALDDALRYAVYAYASRWLYFRNAFQITRGVDEERAQKMERDIRNHLWRRARTSMYAAMARPSYRSILALFLFVFIEMPEDNEDRGFNRLCCEVLFSHFNYMRSPTQRQTARPLSEYTTVLPLHDEAVDLPVPRKDDGADEKLDHLRTSMFWLGVICDSTRSLLQQCPSIVLPGRSGDAKVWDLIRQRNVIFDQSFRGLHTSPLPLPHDVTDIVLQHALACKTMHFGMLNQFLDAAFHNPTGSIDDAAQRLLDESCRFHDTLGPLLSMCARDYSNMQVGCQLNYSMCQIATIPKRVCILMVSALVVTHYHLGSLVLADVLDTLEDVPEPLKDPKLSRLHACTAIANAISLALNYDRYSEDESPYESLLLRDPTPITMVETLSRTGKAVFLLFENEKINAATAQMMISVVVAALTVLSQVSVTASSVLTLLRQKCPKTKLKVKINGQPPVQRTDRDPEHVELLGMCDRDFIDEFFQEMKIMEASDGRSLLDKTIAKYENLSAIQHISPYLSPVTNPNPQFFTTGNN